MKRKIVWEKWRMTLKYARKFVKEHTPKWTVPVTHEEIYWQAQGFIEGHKAAKRRTR
jgi:hypothetical protein